FLKRKRNLPARHGTFERKGLHPPPLEAGAKAVLAGERAPSWGPGFPGPLSRVFFRRSCARPLVALPVSARSQPVTPHPGDRNRQEGSFKPVDTAAPKSPLVRPVDSDAYLIDLLYGGEEEVGGAYLLVDQHPT